MTEPFASATLSVSSVWACDKAAIEKAFSEVFVAIDQRRNAIIEYITTCPSLFCIDLEARKHEMGYLQTSLSSELQVFKQQLLLAVRDRTNLTWKIAVQYVAEPFTRAQYQHLFQALWVEPSYDAITGITYIRPIAKTERTVEYNTVHGNSNTKVW